MFIDELHKQDLQRQLGMHCNSSFVVSHAKLAIQHVLALLL